MLLANLIKKVSFFFFMVGLLQPPLIEPYGSLKDLNFRISTPPDQQKI